MPIYEYQALHPERACPRCRNAFEILQRVDDKPVERCPECGERVRKIISWCRAAVAEASPESENVKRRIKDYEQSGMWSHAAELADKYSEKTRDKSLKMRAVDNYSKAGYDADSLSRHLKSGDD